MQDVAQLPVGIENLALAFSLDHVKEQGDFISQLIKPVQGFVVLDLHNIYCQSENFNVDMMDIIDSYPLDDVKEIHVSGGSWEQQTHSNRSIRRDTHDGSIPDAIFEILPHVLQKCKYVEFLIFERLGNSFRTPKDYLDYQNEFKKLKEILTKLHPRFEKRNWGTKDKITQLPLNDLTLYKEQRMLCDSFLKGMNDKDITLLNIRWDTSEWDKDMIQTAIKLSQKWG